VRFTCLISWAAVTIVGCGGSTFTASQSTDASAGAAGTPETGGSGTGGAGTGQDGGKACTPLPGCSSLTMCNDGCNTCFCSNGEWGCTERACPPMDAGRSDAGQGACNTDQDCVFLEQSGCCGMCLATGDPIPSPRLCQIMCPVVSPGCVCINHKCGTGAVPLGQSCQISHDLCTYGLLCCQQCGGPFVPDAQACSPPVCTQPSLIGMKPGCPPPAP